MSDKTATQFEKYWREKIANEILDYIDETHVPAGRGEHNPRQNIEAALIVVTNRILAPTKD